VRRHDRGDPGRADRFDQRLQEVPARQGVEGGQRFVQQENLWSLGNGGARATWARCPPDSAPARRVSGTSRR
jgi:hypothetical protein